MCTQGERGEERPDLPQVDLELDDPLGAIPSDLRPDFITAQDHRCPDCGHYVSDDEYHTWGGHKSHMIHQTKGLVSNHNPKPKSPDKPSVRMVLMGQLEKPPTL